MNKNWMNENTTGIDPVILMAMAENSEDVTRPFGDDDLTREVVKQFRDLAGADCQVVFATTGTAGNGIALSLITKGRHDVIIAPFGAHVHMNEYNAQSTFTNGAQIMPCLVKDGKITIEALEDLFAETGENFTNYTCLSITNPTDVGTVYSRDELKALVDYAHGKGLKVHMDAARLPNALAHLNCSFAELSGNIGIDVMTVSGTKAGGFAAEAVLVFNGRYSDRELKMIQKNCGQSVSKERMIAAQFQALMKDGYWIKKAAIANDNAKELAAKLSQECGMEPFYPIETNFAFYENKGMAKSLKAEGYDFFVWPNDMLRFGATAKTQKADIDLLTKDIKQRLGM